MALKEIHVGEYYTTPVVTLEYPYLHSPDTAFEDPGIYHVDFLLNEVQAKEFLQAHADLLDKYIRENNCKDKPIAKTTAKLQPSGLYKIRARMKSVSVDKSTGMPRERRPSVYNADCVDISDNIPMMATGSTGAVQVYMSAYGAKGKAVGVTYRLHAVQVVSVVEPESKQSNSSGFKPQSDSAPGFGFQQQQNHAQPKESPFDTTNKAIEQVAYANYANTPPASDDLEEFVAPDFAVPSEAKKGADYGDF